MIDENQSCKIDGPINSSACLYDYLTYYFYMGLLCDVIDGGRCEVCASEDREEMRELDCSVPSFARKVLG